jgi:hypothetical protein
MTVPHPMDLVPILGKLNITDIRSTVRQRVSVRPFEQECKSAPKWNPSNLKQAFVIGALFAAAPDFWTAG